MNPFVLFVGDSYVGEIKHLGKADEGYDLTLELSDNVPITIYSGTTGDISIRPINDPKVVVVHFQEAVLHILGAPASIENASVHITTPTLLGKEELQGLKKIIG